MLSSGRGVDSETMNRETSHISSNESAWLKLVGEFRQVCVLKRAGMKEESDRILSEVLPGSISAWSRLESSPIEMKRKRLQEMFITEERKTVGVWSAPTVEPRESVLPVSAPNKGTAFSTSEPVPKVAASPRPQPIPASEIPPHVSEAALPSPAIASSPSASPVFSKNPTPPPLLPSPRRESAMEDSKSPVTAPAQTIEGDAFRVRVQPISGQAIVPSLGETYVTQIWQAPAPVVAAPISPWPEQPLEEDPFQELAASLDRVLAAQKPRGILSFLFRNE